MADHQAGILRSYKEFAETMSNLSSFQSLSERDRNRLLRELYSLASDKHQAERRGQIAREYARELRAEKSRALKAAELLGRALQALREACTEYRAEFLEEIETFAPDWKLNFTFAEMEQNLHFSVEWLNAHAAVTAASIHPRLRKVQENLLVKDRLVIYGQSAGGADEPNYPASKEARALDTALIRDAAKVLAKYKQTGRRPSRRVTSIARLFQAAFGETREEESVRKALERGKKPKRAEYTPGRYHSSIAKAFFPDTKFLKPKSPCSKQAHPQKK